MREHGESDDVAKSPRSQVYTDEHSNHHRSPLWRLLLVVLLLALVSFGVWALLHFYFQTVHERNPIYQTETVLARVGAKGEAHETSV
jgi:hypothetical protein